MTAAGHRAGAALGGRVVVLSFLIIMVDGFDTLMISFVAPLLAHAWRLKPTQIGAVFAAGYLGAIVGAVCMGPLADRFGRKPMLAAAMGLAALGAFACAAAPGVKALMALRFISGVALGGALPAVISLTAESVPAGRRSGLVTLMYIGYPAGAVIGGALTASLVRFGWPAIFLGTGAACLLALAATAALPETLAPGPARPPNGSGLQAFGEGRLWPALTLCLALFCLLLLTYFLVSWTPSLIVAGGGSAAAGAYGGVALNLGGILGAAALAPVIDRFGPYLPVALLAAVGAGLVALLGLAPHSSALLLSLLFGCGVAVFGAQLSTPAMVVDLYPPHVRGAGGGWTVGVGRLGSLIGPILGGVLLAARVRPTGLFLAAALPALAAALAFAAAAFLQRRRRSAGPPGSARP